VWECVRVCVCVCVWERERERTKAAELLIPGKIQRSVAFQWIRRIYTHIWLTRSPTLTLDLKWFDICFHLFPRVLVSSFKHSFVRLFLHSFICSFIPLFIRLFVCLFVCSCNLLFIRLFICSFVCLLSHELVAYLAIWQPLCPCVET